MFVVLPFFIGILSVTIALASMPLNLGQAALVACASTVLSAFSLLLAGWEGIICVIAILPMAIPGAIIGAVIVHAVHKRRPPGPPMALLLLVSAALIGLSYATEREPARFTVETSMFVKGSPDQVWNAIINLDRLQPPDIWYARFVACPVEVELNGSGVGAMRGCTMTTGQMLEEVTRWEPGVSLAWVTHNTPPPLREINPFHDVHPPHLDGYVTTSGGEFAIEKAPGGSLVVRRTTLEIRLYPAFYWGFWVRHGTEMAHKHVLNHVAESAEGSRLAGHMTSE